MDRILNTSKPLSFILAILFYLATSTLILTIHGLSPTNMAGPGLDIIVYLLAMVGGAAILAKSIKTAKTKSFNGFRFINIMGSLTMLILTCYTITK